MCVRLRYVASLDRHESFGDRTVGVPAVLCIKGRSDHPSMRLSGASYLSAPHFLRRWSLTRGPPSTIISPTRQPQIRPYLKTKQAFPRTVAHLPRQHLLDRTAAHSQADLRHGSRSAGGRRPRRGGDGPLLLIGAFVPVLKGHLSAAGVIESVLESGFGCRGDRIGKKCSSR